MVYDIEQFSEEAFQLAMAVLMLKANEKFVAARRVQEKLHNLLSTPTVLVRYSGCLGKFTMITN